MITKDQLVDKINDSKISDDEVFEDLNEWLRNDEPPTNEDLRDVEIVAELTYDIRPQVMERIRLKIAEDHKDCCGPHVKDPS